MQDTVEMQILRFLGDRGEWAGIGVVSVLPHSVARMSRPLIVRKLTVHPVPNNISVEMVGYREADTGRVMVSQEQFNHYFH